MSTRAGPTDNTGAMSALAPAELERQVRAVYEEGNMRSLAEELVRLRASHRAQGHDATALRLQLKQTTTEKQQLEADLERMSRLKTQLDTELKRAKAKCGRLEKKLATAGDDSLKRRIHCLERQATVAETFAEADARDEIQRCEELLDLVNTLRPRSRGLHVVALRCVLEHLTLSSGLVHHSYTDGLGFRWPQMIRDLKSVTLVCKSWHAAAYPLLYRDVHLRNVGQIVSFANTLRSSPQTFSPHVHAVMVACYIPQRWERATRQSLTLILQQCPHLNAFIFRPTYEQREYSTNAPLPVLYSNLSPLTIPHNIKHLGLFDLYAAFEPELSPPFSSLALMLSWCSHLTSLSISARSLPAADDSLILHFPRLETLSIWSCDSGQSVSKRLPMLWEMPKLASLRFRPTFTCDDESAVRLTRFFHQHAGTLRELDFGVTSLGELGLANLRHQVHTASLCPHLEHLVLCISYSALLLVSREDVWAVVKESAIWKRPLALVEIVRQRHENRKYPLDELVRGSAWKRVRSIERQLLTWVPNLPYLFPVLDEAPVEPRLVDCYGLKIEESASRLSLVDEGWENPSGPFSATDVDDEESDDGSNSETSDSSYEYESEVSEDYVTDEGESDVEPEELEDLTEEQALAIYAEILGS